MKLTHRGNHFQSEDAVDRAGMAAAISSVLSCFGSAGDRLKTVLPFRETDVAGSLVRLTPLTEFDKKLCETCSIQL